MVFKMKNFRFGLLALAMLLLSGGLLATPGGTTFNYTGGQQTYTVPAGVTSVTVDVKGAIGGGSFGGFGGRVQAKLTVTPGQTLYIYVGGQGTNGNSDGATGYNGGGASYSSTYGSGGGASDIRVGGTTLANRAVVAGGGGGGNSNNNENGGAGGNEIGGLLGSDPTDASAATPGSQTSGGNGGVSVGFTGNNGTLGFGGDGSSADGGSGAGGGGGYYGGGAGGIGAGAGGSSFASATLTSSVTFTQGYQEGNGQVTITADAPSNTTPSFTTTTSTFTICTNTTVDLAQYLHVSDNDASQTETWSQSVAADHGGALVFAAATAASGTTDITPGGTITYTPATDFIGTETFTVQVSDGSASVTKTFTVTIVAPPATSVGAAASICAGNNATLTATGATTYSWTPATALSSTSGASVVANPTVTTVYTVTGSNSGCSTVAFDTVNVNTVPTVNVVTNQTICNGANSTLITFTGSVPGTTYNWINSDTSIGLTASGVDSIASFVATNNTVTPIYSFITVTPVANGCTGSYMSFYLIADPTPVVLPVGDQVMCAGASTTTVVFQGTIIDAGFAAFAPPSATTFNWTNSDTSIGLAASGTGDISSFVTRNTSDTFKTATIVVTPSFDGCTGATQTFYITVKPIPTVDAVSNQVVCNAATISAINFSGAVVGTTFNWTNSDTSIGLAASGIDSIPSFTAADNATLAKYAIIHVAPFADGCTGSARNFFIQVNPTPVVLPVTDQAVCNGVATSAITFVGNAVVPTITFTVPDTTAPTTFNWTNDNTSIGLAASGTGNIASFTGVNNSDTVATATIVVTPVAGNCTGLSQTFHITVNPTPTVNSVANQTICNGFNTTAVTFTGTVAGTTYNWTNTNTTIGIAASGIDSIPSFVATYTGPIFTQGNIVVTPTANGCNGSTASFHYKVFATPVVNPVVSQTVCNTGATTTITFSSASVPTFGPSLTTYTWTNTDTTIGLSSGNTGNIASFTAINNSPVTHIATVTVTPSANGCTGDSQTFTITVNPTPDVAPISNQVLCNGAATTTVTFTGTVAGTSYSWYTADTTIGVAAAGNDSIASFSTINTGITPVISTITVRPSANSCLGETQSFTYTVNPTPVIDTIASQTLCNTAITSAVHFTGAVAGTTYTWTNNDTTIGLSAVGNDSIGAFVAINTSSTIHIATITVTPWANGCSGASRSFTITVNPTPDVATVVNQAVCNGFASTAVNFNGSVAGTSYTWGNTVTSIGLAAEGEGNIASFIVSDTTNAPVVATINVTPSANGCTGANRNFTITANPIPTVAAINNQTLCNTFATTTVHFTGTVAGTTYAWVNADTTIGLAAAGNDSVASFTATNISNIPVTSTIIVTPTANACVGATQSFSVTVNPTPSVNPVAAQTFCDNKPTNTIILTGSVSGSLYSWTNNNTSVGLAAAGADSVVSFTTSNTLSIPVIDTVSIIPTANGCTGATGQFTFTINPLPVLSSRLSDTICSGGTFSYLITGPVVGTVYNWSRPAVSGISPATGSGVTITFSETLTNSTLHPIDVVYVIAMNANGCTNSENVSLKVNPMAPKPVIAIHPPVSLCEQTMYQNFGASHAPEDTVVYTWTANNATVWASDSTDQFAIVSYPTSGNTVVTLSANVTGINCVSKDTFAVTVGTSIAQQPTVVYFAGEFACFPSNMDAFQWGYDNLNLDSTMLTGEVTQDYLNASPDFGHKHYWVMTTKDGCTQKTYYRVPTTVQNVGNAVVAEVKLYPNPSTESVTIEYVGTNDGTIVAEVYNMLGQKVGSALLVDNKAVLNVSALFAGNYIVSCMHNGIKVASSRMVKN